MMALDDDMLRLIFIGCHPAFSMEVQVALTLRTVCGLSLCRSRVPFWPARTPWRSASSAPNRKIRLAEFPTRCRTATRWSRAARVCSR